MQIFTKYRICNIRTCITPGSNYSVARLRGYKMIFMMLIVTGILCNTTRASAAKPSKTNNQTPGIKQSFVLTGTVTDEKDEVLPGATIRTQGSAKATITDVYGKFIIEVPSESDSLIVSFVGFKTQHIYIGATRTIKVKLLPDEANRKLNEVVIVGFGTQKKLAVTGAVSTVKISDLQHSSTPSLSNTIGGMIPGIITRQSSGEPGYDAATVYIRGISTPGNAAPLILVDGVERDMNLLNMQEVESFSVLKDAAATSVYGIRGANGVILITTKRGIDGRPKVTFRTETAQLTAMRLPDYINSYEYGVLTNEAYANVGQPAFYTAEQLQKFKDHSDPYLYPDVDWIDKTLKKKTYQTINNLSLQGGNQTFKYFTNVGYTVQDGIFKEDPTVPYPTNSSLKRYNFRSNVDVSLSKSLSIALNLGGIIASGYYPGTSAAAIFDALNYTPNNSYPFVNPDGSIPGKGTFLSMDPFTRTTQEGYQTQYKTTLQSSLETKWDLSSLVTKGLSVRGLFSYDYFGETDDVRQKQPTTYQYLGPDANGVDQYKVIQTETPLGYYYGNAANRAVYMETAIDYDRTFGKSAISAVIVGNRREYINLTGGTSLDNIPFRRQGLASRFNYSYDSRYTVEFDGGYNGSENFPPNKRYGFFPAASASWIVSNEKFWPKNVISFLRIRDSYGQVGNDQIGGARFLFQSTINKSAPNYLFGSSQTTSSAAFAENFTGTDDVSWEVATKENLGLDMELFDGRIVLSADAFTEHRTGILLRRQQIPSSAGFSNLLPFANLGIVNNRGIDGTLEIKNRTKSGFYYSFKGNFTYAHNKLVEDDSPIKALGYQNSRGQTLGRPYGYISLGLFKDQHEIDNSPSQTSLQATIRPGDIKYKDLNGDGVINTDDQTFFGYPRIPEITYGFGTTLAYKGFDLSIYFTGAAHSNLFVTGRSSWAFQDGVGNYNVFADYYDHRWIPGADNSKAEYPSVIDVRSTNNYITNTTYMKDGSYLRLKAAEIGYNLPKHFTEKAGISAARLFINGTNLLLWDHVKIFDPEIDNGNLAYPLQRTLNLGLQVTF